MNGIFIKSVSGLRLFKNVIDTEDEYSVGTEDTDKIVIPGTQTISPTDKGEDFTIYADDGIYAAGKTKLGTDIALQNVFIPLSVLEALTGAKMASGTLEESIHDEAPAFGMAFKALLSNGGFLLCRYYVVTLNSYEVGYQTSGQNKEGSPYKLSLTAKPRAVDGRYRGLAQIASGAPLTWLDSIPTVKKGDIPPAGSEG